MIIYSESLSKKSQQLRTKLILQNGSLSKKDLFSNNGKIYSYDNEDQAIKCKEIAIILQKVDLEKEVERNVLF